MAVRLDEHCRLTMLIEVSTGMPAWSAAMWAAEALRPGENIADRDILDELGIEVLE